MYKFWCVEYFADNTWWLPVTLQSTYGRNVLKNLDDDTRLVYSKFSTKLEQIGYNGFENDPQDAAKFCELLTKTNPGVEFRMVHLEVTTRYLEIYPSVKRERE